MANLLAHLFAFSILDNLKEQENELMLLSLQLNYVLYNFPSKYK
jgi:hypothetical protein